jgi:uncharacterized protein (DUF2267 family)
MQYDDFVGQVQNRAGLASTGEAVGAIRATLQTFAERLAGNEASHLAAQLPREIGAYLRASPDLDSRGQSFSLDEFFRRVSEKEGTDLPDAVYHARVIVEMLGEAVSAGEMADVRAQLPDEYQRLFEAGSTGQMPRDE